MAAACSTLCSRRGGCGSPWRAGFSSSWCSRWTTATDGWVARAGRIAPHAAQRLQHTSDAPATHPGAQVAASGTGAANHRPTPVARPLLGSAIAACCGGGLPPPPPRAAQLPSSCPPASRTAPAAPPPGPRDCARTPSAPSPVQQLGAGGGAGVLPSPCHAVCGCLPAAGGGHARHQAREHTAAMHPQPAAPADQGLRLWLLQARQPQHAQEQGGRAAWRGQLAGGQLPARAGRCQPRECNACSKHTRTLGCRWAR